MPSWAVTISHVSCCSCGYKRFKKVNPDGTDAPIKVKTLKDIRKAPASTINWSTEMVGRDLESNCKNVVHHYCLDVTTKLDKRETLKITAVSRSNAEDLAWELVVKVS